MDQLCNEHADVRIVQIFNRHCKPLNKYR
jgi:hypothetical protein